MTGAEDEYAVPLLLTLVVYRVSLSIKFDSNTMKNVLRLGHIWISVDL